MNILHEKLINSFIDKAGIYQDADLITQKLKAAYPNQNLVHKKTIARFLDGTTQNPRDGLLGFLAAYVLSIPEDEVDLAYRRGTLNEFYDTFVQTVGYVTPKDLPKPDNEKQLSRTIRVLIVVILLLSGVVVYFAMKMVKTNLNPEPYAKPNMVTLPSDSFLLGDTFNQTEDSTSNEKPSLVVYVEQFAISDKEITFDQFDAYCKAKGLTLKNSLWGRNSQPIIMVNWFEAVSYCNWLSSEQNLDCVYKIENKDGFQIINSDLTKNGYRLPTEAEFEYAASINIKNQRKFLYGNHKDIADREDGLNFDHSKTNNYHITYEKNVLGTVEVEKSSINSSGLFGMSGNVAEWCHDRYTEHRYQNLKDTINPVCNKTDIPYAVIRGGSFKSDFKCIRTSYRTGKVLDSNSEDVGFRIVRKIKDDNLLSYKASL
jgi:formylglycine-generating enzyme required for sulfatase activity